MHAQSSVHHACTTRHASCVARHASHALVRLKAFRLLKPPPYIFGRGLLDDMMSVCLFFCLSVRLSPVSTINFHSTEGATHLLVMMQQCLSRGRGLSSWSMARKTLFTFLFPVVLTFDLYASKVALVPRYVSTKLEVSTTFPFR